MPFPDAAYLKDRDFVALGGIAVLAYRAPEYDLGALSKFLDWESNGSTRHSQAGCKDTCNKGSKHACIIGRDSRLN